MAAYPETLQPQFHVHLDLAAILQNHPEVFYITVKVNTYSGALAIILQIALCIREELFRFLSMPHPKVLRTLI